MVTLHYEQYGTGEDVLLVHGMGRSGKMWRSVVEPLVEHARFWAVDLQGFGRTPIDPQESPTVEQHVRVLAAFCEQHGLRPKVVIGHSMGGMITLKLALQQPDIMEKLLLICPSVTGKFGAFGILSDMLNTPAGQSILQNGKPLWDLMRPQMVAPFITAYLKFDYQLAQDITEDYEKTHWEAAVHGLLSMVNTNLRPRLDEIQQPTVVIIGELDDIVPPSEGQLAVELMPNAQLETFNNARHLPQNENPQRFLTILRELLEIR